MPHERKRHGLPYLKKLASFWPTVGVLGMRQSGKSTLLREQLGIENLRTFDDEDTLRDARASSKNFLLKTGTPAIIDEAQKVPEIFDAIKLLVDRKKRPGTYYLTGSSQFSAKIGIRESLTGRIGLLRLHPFTLAEAEQKELEAARAAPFHKLKPRFKVEDLVPRLPVGGLPVPLFARDQEQRRQYHRIWMDTAVLRDAARVYGRGYDPEITWSLLRQMGAALKEGELPTLKHFGLGSRKLRKYLEALEEIFILRRSLCHEAGTGADTWMPTDSGLAAQIMGTDVGEGANLSLARILVLNELIATAEYAGEPVRPLYFKTARGHPVDLVWRDTAIKISALPKSRQAYDERPLTSALKAMGLARGILVTPHEDLKITAKGISTVPWTYWS